eukprot:COSAG01_NODE_6766_length_3508_cov_6.329715_2_plen_74_part_00
MAIASAMASYIAAGLVGMLMYTRKSSIEWGPTAVLLAAATPAAFFGSFFLKYHLRVEMITIITLDWLRFTYTL